MEISNITQCPVCLRNLPSGRNFLHLEDYSADNQNFSLYQCPLCEVKFWTPFKNPGPEWYRKCEQNLKHRDVQDREYFLWLAQNRGITKHFFNNPPHSDPHGLKLLDVGCGTGGFLIEARKIGYEVTGVDFDIEQINVAKSYGLEKTYAEDVLHFLQSHPEKFDIITGFEIIEHVDNPLAFLRAIYGALKPQGVLCLTTPNNNRIGLQKEFWDFPYHHLTRWTKKSLFNIATLADFKSIRIKEELPLSYFISKMRIGLGVYLRKKKPKKMNNSATPLQYKDTVSKLGSIKDRILSIALKPVAYLLFLLGKKGQGLYLTAKK